jgi:hypothetical protein
MPAVVGKPPAAQFSTGIYGFPGALSNARAAARLTKTTHHILSHHFTSHR